jgi:hypothetical protein
MKPSALTIDGRYRMCKELCSIFFCGLYNAWRTQWFILGIEYIAVDIEHFHTILTTATINSYNNFIASDSIELSASVTPLQFMK